MIKVQNILFGFDKNSHGHRSCALAALSEVGLYLVWSLRALAPSGLPTRNHPSSMGARFLREGPLENFSRNQKGYFI